MDSRRNTVARYKLLNSALQGSTNVPPTLLAACKSQGGLAKYSNSREGIEPMALNTLKSCAEKYIEDGGWAKLDDLRKTYFAITKSAKRQSYSARDKKRIQKDKLAELENDLNNERRFRIRLQTAYEALLAHLRIKAKTDPTTAHFINGHVAGFSFKLLKSIGEDTRGNAK